MEKWRAFRNSPRYEDAKGGVVKKGKNLLMTILQIILIVGISYVILSPVIGIVAQSFFSDADSANPMVYTIPIEGTLERYTTVITQMDYFRTLGNTLIYTIALTLIQVLICSMVGYGFARFDFPLKKLLFGCVVLMIVIPNHTIMLPQYMTFRSMGLMSEATPMYILTLFGTGFARVCSSTFSTSSSAVCPRKSRKRRLLTAREHGTPTSASCSSTPCLPSSR